MAIEKCFSKLIKTGMLKDSGEFENRIVSWIESVSFEKERLNHKEKWHNITIG